MYTTKLKNMVKRLIMTPSLYVAFVIGAFFGGIAGGLGGGITGSIIGFLSGGTLSEQFKGCIQWPSTILNYHISESSIDLISGALIGAALGSSLGSICIGISTGFCVYLNNKLPFHLSNVTIKPVIKFCCIVASILGLGLFLGALLGEGVHRLLGPAIGAFFVFGLTLVATIGWIRNQ